VRVAVDIDLDEPMGTRPAGRGVLWERQRENLELAAAVRFLREAVDELCAVERPFGALVQPPPEAQA
jgi:hypothetical protein